MNRSKVTEQLVKDGVLIKHEGMHLLASNFKETGVAKFDTIRNMTSTEYGVVVKGVGKSGSHLALSILDALGCDRAEEVGVEGGITPFPFEFQRTHQVYKRMEKKIFSLSSYPRSLYQRFQRQNCLYFKRCSCRLCFSVSFS